MKRSYSDHCTTQSTQAGSNKDACSSDAAVRPAGKVRLISDEELGHLEKKDITDKSGDSQNNGDRMTVQRWLGTVVFNGDGCDDDSTSENDNPGNNDNPGDSNSPGDNISTMTDTIHDLGSGRPDSAYASSEISTSTAEVTEYTFFGQCFQSARNSEPQPVEETYIKACNAIYQYPNPEDDGHNLPHFCKALDLGPGNSTWAITMARRYPRMKILGIYESSQFRQNDPANFTVMLDNIESGVKELKTDEYDIIHVRDMEGCISDYPTFYQYLFQILRPGGLMIHREFALSSETAKLLNWWPVFERDRVESLEQRRCEVNVCARMEKMMKVQFQDVTSQIFDVPAAPFLGSIDCRVAKVAYDLGWSSDLYLLHGTMMRKEAMENKQTVLYNCYSVSGKKHYPPDN